MQSATAILFMAKRTTFVKRDGVGMHDPVHQREGQQPGLPRSCRAVEGWSAVREHNFSTSTTSVRNITRKETF